MQVKSIATSSLREVNLKILRIRTQSRETNQRTGPGPALQLHPVDGDPWGKLSRSGQTFVAPFADSSASLIDSLCSHPLAALDTEVLRRSLSVTLHIDPTVHIYMKIWSLLLNQRHTPK